VQMVRRIDLAQDGSPRRGSQAALSSALVFPLILRSVEGENDLA
jgi:hypothetical protein